MPVKYNFGQLWRWKVVLDRFALSAANTIGIEAAYVTENIQEPSAVFVNGAKPVGNDQFGYRDWGTVRNMVGVHALEPAVVVDALPRLLPALGIPIDAVGVIIATDHRPLRIEALPGETTQPATTPQPVEASGDTSGGSDNPPQASATDTAPNDATDAGPASSAGNGNPQASAADTGPDDAIDAGPTSPAGNDDPQASAADTGPDDATESGPPLPGVAAPPDSPTSSPPWVVLMAGGIAALAAATLAALLTARRRGH